MALWYKSLFKRKLVTGWTYRHRPALFAVHWSSTWDVMDLRCNGQGSGLKLQSGDILVYSASLAVKNYSHFGINLVHLKLWSDLTLTMTFDSILLMIFKLYGNLPDNRDVFNPIIISVLKIQLTLCICCNCI